VTSTAHIGSVHIHNKGEAFRRSVRQALDIWARERPMEVRQFVTDCKAMKSRKLDDKGYIVGDSGKRDTDIAYLAITPEYPETILGMSPFQTKFLWGVECGTGDKLWRLDLSLNRIFKDELACGILSPMRV
jgi:hypothetical protein